LSKISLCAAVLALISCGGAQTSRFPKDGSTDSPACLTCPASISASQVFSNTAQTWTLQNGYGDLTWIDVMPQSDGSTIWHYHKNACRAYWMIGGCSAELWFKIAIIDGKWYSTGGHIVAPLGFPWDTTGTPQDFEYSVTGDPGMPRPYLIIADSGTNVDTTFPDFGVHTRWKTSMYVENGELISEQWEGPCVHEKWHFAIGRGLVKVEPLDDGSCVPADPKLTMFRIN
jgi:hypothetical protein